MYKKKIETFESAKVFDDFGSATFAMHVDFQDHGGGGVVFLSGIVVFAAVGVDLLLQHHQQHGSTTS